MKNSIRAIILAAICAAACTKGPVEVAVGEPVEMSLEATFAGVSKVSADLREGTVEWEAGDRISLLHNTGNYPLTSVSGGQSTVFKGTVTKLPEGESYLAVYPFDENYKLEGNTFNVNIPAFLPLTPESFSGCLGTGTVADGKVVFNHSTGYLCFTVSRNDIRSISIASSDGKPLSGSFKATADRKGGISLEGIEGKCSPEVVSTSGCVAGDYFIVLPPNKYNGFTVKMVCGEGNCEYKIEKYLNVPCGKAVDLGVIDSDVKWESRPAPTLSILDCTSSTVSASWSVSNFQSPATDLMYGWSIGIFEDAACTDLRVSWDIPSSVFTSPEGTILAIEGPFSPRFIFTGLESGREYWVKAWHTDEPECASEIVAARTLESSNVTLDQAGSPEEGTVILAEDFSELVWGGDIAGRNWSYTDGNAASATAFVSATGENPVGEQPIGEVKHKFALVYPGNESGLFSTMKNAVASSRLKGWGSISEDGSKSRVCGRSGYVKLGGGNVSGGIVTPALSCLDGMASVKVSFKAHPYRELANDNTVLKVMSISTPEGSLNVDGTYSNEYSVNDSFEITPSSETGWKDYSGELFVAADEKIAIYTQRAAGVSNGQCRVLLDDIKIEVIKKYSGDKVLEISNVRELQSFLLNAADYSEGETVTLMEDIDLSGVELTGATSFAATFDGKGHSLKNWKSNKVALFRNLTGTVKNLVLDSSCSFTPAVNGDWGPVACFVEASGLVENCTNNAPVTLEISTFEGTRIGGLVGRMDGTVSGSTNNGKISIHLTGSPTGNPYIGGVVGLIRNGSGYTRLAGCTNNGDIEYVVDGTAVYTFIGGISAGTATREITTSVTTANADIENCTNTGNISFTLKNGGSLEDGQGTAGAGNYTNIGGVVAYWEGSITNCVNGVSGDSSKGRVTLTVPTSNSANAMSRPAVGGVCAFALFNVKDCKNYGSVNVKGSFANAGSIPAAAGILKCPSIGGVVGQAGPLAEAESRSVSGCHNYGSIVTELWQNAGSGTESYVGGVAGYSLIALEDCSNSGAMTVRSKTNLNYIGGVVGYSTLASANLENSGSIEGTFLRDGGSNQIGGRIRLGGVAGYTKGTLTSCTNKTGGTVTVSIPVQAAQFNVGGVFGQSLNASLQFSGLKNYGKVQMTVDQTSLTSYSYLGGCTGNDVQGPKYPKCENHGDVIFTGATKMRIAGIVPYTDQNLSDLTSKCSITVNCNGKPNSEIGGVIGYTAATGLTNWTFEGTIDTSGSTAKVYTGGLLGKSNGHSNFNGCSFKGNLTGASGNNVPGLYVGGLQADKLAMTFGAAQKCTVTAGSDINGTVVTALTLENLVSQSSDKSTFTSTATLTNIVIE